MKPSTTANPVITIAMVAALLVSGCTGKSDPVESPEPTPSVLMKPIVADDDSAFYGIGAIEGGQDQYGTFSTLWVNDISTVSNLDSVAIDDAVTERFDHQAIVFAARYLTRFLVESYLDTPLVFDDSPDVRNAYWSDTTSYWADVDFMREFFDERPEPEPWALLDDDRGQWRQNGEFAYTPVPYLAGQSRTKIQSIELVEVTYAEVEWRGVMQPLMKFEFDVAYDRDVILADGAAATEHTIGGVGFSFGRLEGLNGPITGVNWGTSTWVGHYIEGGTWGLPEVSAPAEPAGSTIAVGDSLLVPAPEGFTTQSDLDRAQERGIRVTSFEAPDVVISYYEGPQFDANAVPGLDGGGEPNLVNEYVFTAEDPTPRPDSLRPSDELRDAAGEYGEEEFFLPLGGEAVRLSGPGIASGYVDYRPVMFGEIYDIVNLYVVSEAGPTFLARYYVAKGNGVDTYNALRQGWGFLPAASDASEMSTANPVG